MTILTVLNEAFLDMDDKKIMLLVLLDLSFAFDSVDHTILAQRLRVCGINGKNHNWIMSYLSNRTQAVVIDGCVSDKV